MDRADTYNLNLGGMVHTSSEQTRRKISDTRKKLGLHHTEEWKKQHSQDVSGERNHWFGKHLPEHVKRKISEGRKGKYTGSKSSFFGRTHSDETKRKLSEAMKGNTPWITGKHHSEETRKKLSDKAKKRCATPENNPMYGKRGKDNPNYGKKRTEEQLRRMSESHKGIRLSEEAKRKISESLTGRPGHKHSEDTKKKISEARRRYWEMRKREGK